MEEIERVINEECNLKFQKINKNSFFGNLELSNFSWKYQIERFISRVACHKLKTFERVFYERHEQYFV